MRLTITELATGYWQATFEGEEADAAIDRSPDQALASLIRAHIRRLGIESITYESRVPTGDELGGNIFPLGAEVARQRSKGDRPPGDAPGKDDNAPVETGRA